MRSIFIIVSSLFILGTTACDKDNGGSEPEVETNILITSPTPSTVYINGAMLKVEGEMSDNNVLASARVEIRNKTTGAALFQQSNPTGNVGFYRFLWNWTVTGITTATTATIKVTAKDKLGNEVSKEVEVLLDL